MMASSDLSSLYYLLANSLSNQEQLRKDAEAQLEQVPLVSRRTHNVGLWYGRFRSAAIASGRLYGRHGCGCETICCRIL